MTSGRRRRRDWRGPELFGLLLVIAGIYWLLSETGLFFWLGWSYLWPLTLIGLGVLLVISRTSASGGHQSVSLPREIASQAELDIGFGGGRLRLEGGSAQLVDVSSTNDDVRAEISRNGSTARARLRQSRYGIGHWWGGPEGQVRAAADLPTDLRLNGGAGDFDLDLSGMAIVRAAVSIGAANVRLVLPRPRGQVELRVSTGAASVTVVVPDGVQARVMNSGGLISIDGQTETPGYASAIDRVLVRITGGASSINVR